MLAAFPMPTNPVFPDIPESPSATTGKWGKTGMFSPVSARRKWKTRRTRPERRRHGRRGYEFRQKHWRGRLIPKPRRRNGRGVWLEAVNFPVFPDIPDGLSTRGGKLGKVGNVAPGKRQNKNRKSGGYNGRAASLEDPQMNAAQIIKEATAIGIDIAIDGDDLLLEAAAQPPRAVVDLISRHKPDILLLLRFGGDGFADAFAALERKCPDYVELERWRQCLADARQFLRNWGRQADALGWTANGSIRTASAAIAATSILSAAFPLR